MSDVDVLPSLLRVLDELLISGPLMRVWRSATLVMLQQLIA